MSETTRKRAPSARRRDRDSALQPARAPGREPKGIETPRAALRRLYRDISGYDIPSEEERGIRARRCSPTYGEINYASVEALISYLQIGADDVVYDLGSGVGKMIMQVAMTSAARKCVGVELAPSRHASANAVLERARGLLGTRDCRFIHGDFMEIELADATVVYTCSTTFSDNLMRRLTRRLSTFRPGLRFVTTRHPIARHGFVLEATLRLDMSWHRRSPVYIYRLPAG